MEKLPDEHAQYVEVNYEELAKPTFNWTLNPTETELVNQLSLVFTFERSIDRLMMMKILTLVEMKKILKKMKI